MAAMKSLLLIVLAGLFPVIAPAWAANSEPVEIQAQSMELDHAKSTVRFEKDVRLMQGDFELHCDRLIGHYGEKGAKTSELEQAEAYGHVTMRHGATKGHADEAKLDNSKGQIVLIGHAVLEQEGRRIEGNSIIHDLRQQNTAVRSQGDSRVHMTLESGGDSKALIPEAGGEAKP